jgi:acyl carrier protein
LLPGIFSLLTERNSIIKLVIESVANHSSHPSNEFNENSPLIGSDRLLDSIGLVSMLVELETRLADLTDKPIRLMDDRAMSQSRSPFRSIGTLADYICSLLQESATS